MLMHAGWIQIHLEVSRQICYIENIYKLKFPNDSIISTTSRQSKTQYIPHIEETE